KDRFSEVYDPLEEDLETFKEFLGPELHGWLETKKEGLPKLSYKQKRVPAYIDDEEEAEDLYEQGLTFRNDYESTKQLVADKCKQVKPVLEHLAKRKQEEARKIS